MLYFNHINIYNLSTTKNKEKSPVSNETQSPSSKNENEIFESIFINGLEKRNLFHKAITDLRTKVNESLKLKESSIQTILKCGNEGERTENKLVNLMLKFKEDKNQLEKVCFLFFMCAFLKIIYP